jgi:hypothetical protein
MKIDIKKALGLAIMATTLAITCTFDVVPFPIFGGESENYGKPCYSPNMDYYIERYTTLPKALIVTPSHSKSGLAILYDKTGKELYRGTTNDIYKPGWFGDKVSFFGRWGEGGYSGAKLPSSVGGEFIGCFSPNPRP